MALVQSLLPLVLEVLGSAKGAYATDEAPGGSIASMAALCTIVLGRLVKNMTSKQSFAHAVSLASLFPQEYLVASPETGEPHTAATHMLEPGDIVVVNQGDRVPVDGPVLSGSASVNQKCLTGDDRILQLSAGDRAYAGSLRHTRPDSGACRPAWSRFSPRPSSRAGDGIRLSSFIELGLGLDRKRIFC